MNEAARGSVSIVIVGPSSTGKSTLCAALTKTLKIPDEAHVTEVARHVMKEKGYSRHTVGMLQMQQDILDAHLLKEEAASQHPICICDRSAIDPIVYAILTSTNDMEAGERQQRLAASARFQKAIERYHSAVVILLKPVAAWLVDDGVRSMEGRDSCLELFRRLLTEHEITHLEIGEETMDLEERVQVVLSLIKVGNFYPVQHIRSGSETTVK